MSSFFVSDAASLRIDEIYRYARKTWGDPQARKYILGLFDLFDQLARRERPWRVIPAEFGVQGYFTQYEKHFVFWRKRKDCGISILSILAQNMDVANHLSSDAK